MDRSCKLHICLTADDFLPAGTGVGVHLKLVAPELAHRGHRITVVTSRRKDQPPSETWEGVSILRMPTLTAYGFPQALPSSSRLRALLTQLAPDLVHHHYAGLMMRRCTTVARELGLKQVSTYHFGPEVLTQPLPLRPLRSWVQREMMAMNNRCDLVLSPSSALVPRLQELGFTAPVRYIPNPVAFAPALDVDRTPDAVFSVLFAGRLGVEKNVQLLLRAFALVRRSMPARLRIAGRGPEDQKLRKLATELGIDADVDFLGFLDHAALSQQYASCDVFVLPSLQEVQPLVAIEAMWFGRPVILTSALAAAPELITPGENGDIADPQDPADLAAKLKHMAEQPGLRAHMGRQARAHAQQFKLSAVVDAVEAAYAELLAR